MGERCPVQTSVVYVLGRASQFAAVPPPSPPSPAVGNSRDTCAPIEELSLDTVDSTTTSTAGAAGAAAAAAVTALTAATPDDAGALTSPPATAPTSTPTSAPTSAPDSPDLSPYVLSPNLSSCSLASYASSHADHPGGDAAADAAGVDTLVSSIATISAATTWSSPAPPASDHVASRLAGAVHVLATEATALQSVAQLYATSPEARGGFDQAVEAIVRTQTTYPPGKLVVVGVGKSGHIGRKLVATFNSLAIPASFLHPTEALHGDLGHIRAHDALLFITYSGKSHELVSLLPHVDPALPLIILTGHITPETCELVRRRNEANAASEANAAGEATPGAGAGPTILLPAPIPVEEKVSFGVAAPTASTTTALAVGDALAIVTSKELHPSTESVFRRNHPGGAIGEAFKQPPNSSSSSSSLSSMASAPPTDTVRHLAVPWKDIPVVHGADCADVLRAGYSSTNGWVRIVLKDVSSGGGSVEYIAPPSRIRGLCSADLARPVLEVGSRLVVGRSDLVAVAADTKLLKAAEWLKTAARAEAVGAGLPASEHGQDGDTVAAVMEHGDIMGVLELQDLLKAEAEG